MPRSLRIVASACAVALAAYALAVLLAGPIDDGRGEDGLVRVPPASDTQVRADARDRLRDYMRAVEQPRGVGLPGDDLVDDDDAIPVLGPEGVGEQDARQGFEHIMKRVEALGSKRRRLTQDEWRQTYRAANDAFAALSMHLDAHDSNQAAELEDAYHRLKTGLDGVRVRGDKFSYR